MVAIALAMIAGATLYVDWAIERKVREHQIEATRDLLERIHAFNEFEKEMELAIADISFRLAQLEKQIRDEAAHIERLEKKPPPRR